MAIFVCFCFLDAICCYHCVWCWCHTEPRMQISLLGKMGHALLYAYYDGAVHQLLHCNVSAKGEKQRARKKGIVEDWWTGSMEWTPMNAFGTRLAIIVIWRFMDLSELALKIVKDWQSRKLCIFKNELYEYTWEMDLILFDTDRCRVVKLKNKWYLSAKRMFQKSPFSRLLFICTNVIYNCVISRRNGMLQKFLVSLFYADVYQNNAMVKKSAFRKLIFFYSGWRFYTLSFILYPFIHFILFFYTLFLFLYSFYTLSFMCSDIHN